MNGPETAAIINRLTQEVAKLSLQQRNVLQLAIYVGMTPTQAGRYDDRQQRILLFRRALTLLQNAQ